jgi:hypothetical protein
LIIVAISLGIKLPERAADHLLPYNDNAKNVGAIPPHPPYLFMAQCLTSYAQRQLYVVFTSELTEEE